MFLGFTPAPSPPQWAPAPRLAVEHGSKPCLCVGVMVVVATSIHTHLHLAIFAVLHWHHSPCNSSSERRTVIQSVSTCDYHETWMQRKVYAFYVVNNLSGCTPGRGTAGAVGSRGSSSRGQGRRGNQNGGRFVSATGLFTTINNCNVMPVVPAVVHSI